MQNTPPPAPAPWAALIPEEQWRVLTAGAEALDEAGARFLLAGALALATYTGHWRNTKDMDVIVHATDRERAIAALQRAGFEDYYPQQAYDRSWIFRGIKEGVLFDVIWALPNHRVGIDEAWFERAGVVTLHGREYRVAPAEELVRVKLYVMQRERCDWVDVLNVLAASVEHLSWPWLVERMGRDLPLLHAALAIFNWMCPGRAHALPPWLRKQFALARVEADDLAATEERRVRLFDSRPWFAPHQPLNEPLER
ncbi:nucleotidyltransferase family protein [Opitutus terrae]|uniref:nucleotidyltransferase family protein n=1 Tax=Opitutus terrae TaxID=107709 RepID=UPI0013050B98|nr:nucleotidyltransferase family protein [Opitutus terrae]